MISLYKNLPTFLLICSYLSCGQTIQNYPDPQNGRLDPNSTLIILSSSPESRSIDAGMTLFQNQPQGWNEVLMTFSGDVSTVRAEDFILEQFGKAMPIPNILKIEIMDETTLLLKLDSPLTPGTCNKIIFKPSLSAIFLGFLPGDVDASGLVEENTDGELLDETLKGSKNRPPHSSDVDRDGKKSNNDMTVFDELLDGSHDGTAWLQKSIPICWPKTNQPQAPLPPPAPAPDPDPAPQPPTQIPNPNPDPTPPSQPDPKIPPRQAPSRTSKPSPTTPVPTTRRPGTPAPTQSQRKLPNPSQSIPTRLPTRVPVPGSTQTQRVPVPRPTPTPIPQPQPPIPPSAPSTPVPNQPQPTPHTSTPRGQVPANPSIPASRLPSRTSGGQNSKYE